MPTILDNDEGPDYFLNDEFTLESLSTMFNVEVAFYWNGFKWVVALQHSGRHTVFADRDITFVIKQVQEHFGGHKPEALKNALRKIGKDHPELLDKLYKVV